MASRSIEIVSLPGMGWMAEPVRARRLANEAQPSSACDLGLGISPVRRRSAAAEFEMLSKMR
jgi:hypothetical protein